MIRIAWLVLLFVALTACSGDSGDAGGGGEGEGASFAGIVEKSDHHEGFFDLYRDKKTGETYLGIDKDQIDQEFIYNAMVADGILDGFRVRGVYGDNKVLSIRRHYNKIEFVTENNAFYFDPDSPLARAADANISDAVLSVLEIAAEDEESGTVLVKADGLFLKDSLQQLKGPPNPDPNAPPAFDVGNLSDSKSKIYEVRTYPDNTNVFVDYVFENPIPAVPGERDITDSRFVSVRLQHMFVKMPDNDFQPRIDDSRVGYFLQYITDQTTASHTPYRDLINRWHLVKKDPDAELSEPVEPIVWWIENTTPMEIRDSVREGALAWNQSFERAGFKNAIQVKVQPDDADWDAGDIRYNVLRWTSSPRPPFGGYGPSFTNPRTGQILGADIMLENMFLTRLVQLEDLLDSIAGKQSTAAFNGEPLYCSLGHRLQMENNFAMHAIEMLDMGDNLKTQMLDDSLRMLMLHEIGHTLGLNHNMKASSIYTLDQINDADFVDENGLTGSVMDYAPVHLATPGRDQTWFYDKVPGKYDDWAIEFGYSPDLDGPDGEANRKALLDRSTDPVLAFGNDADDMRAPGFGIDPRTNIGDMSTDPIGYASERMDLANAMLRELPGKAQTEGESQQKLLYAYLNAAGVFAGAARVTSKWIGGVQVNRAKNGQPGATTPYVPVAESDQRRAMQVLRNKVFAPNALQGSEELYSHIAQQRRDFDFFGNTEDPKLHDIMLDMHKSVLDHLMHPTVLKRITDSRQYGNTYELTEVMQDTTNAIFSDDMTGNVNTYRQNLQLEYVNRLLAMTTGDTKAAYDYPSQSAALHNLRQIERSLRANPGNNTETRVHRSHILYTINQGLDP